MKPNHLHPLLPPLINPLLFLSCHSREVAYIFDAQRDSAVSILQTYTETILPGDQLYIHVGSQTPESANPFNPETHRFRFQRNKFQYFQDTAQNAIHQDSLMRVESLLSKSEISGYFVSDSGTIVFPLLGEIYVAGITQDSLRTYLEKRISSGGYVVDPQVETELLNFRVTVVGEVREPKQIHVEGTRLSIFEALAICGDITDYGRRDNLVVIRSENNTQEIGEIDLTKKEMLDSPYYYLHNNDIVYVEPNNRKKRDAVRDPNIPRYISIGVNVAYIMTISYRAIRNQNQSR